MRVFVLALAAACNIDDRSVGLGDEEASSDTATLSGSPNEPVAPVGARVEVATGCPPGGCVDCAGVAGGTARVDECGTCDTDLANDCPRDCAGTWGGSARRDLCGVCDTDPTNDCEGDCQSMAGGAAWVDNCGVCDADPSNDCVLDCQGQWGGGATVDPCGVCDTDPSNDCVQAQDCVGISGGLARLDACGVCDDDPTNDCVQDCSGVFGGVARLDACGVCDNDPTNDCFEGTSGSMIVTAGELFDIGNGPLSWSLIDGQLGFLSYTLIPPTPFAPGFARVTESWGCTDAVAVNGYEGFASVRDINVVGVYTGSGAIGFGTRASECQTGLLLFSWNGQYGVLDFESIDDTGTTLTLRYWLADPDTAGFSNAPE